MAKTYTFLFTDIEGSTRLWEQHPQVMGEIIARHDALLGAVVEAHAGQIFKTVGDGVHAVFIDADAAIQAAVAAQRALFSEDWSPLKGLRVRVGVHTGPASTRLGDYFGPTLNQVARLMDAGHGGQILLSQATRDALSPQALNGDVRDLGERRLKDLPKLEHIYQLEPEDLPHHFPPLRTLDVRPSNLPAQPTSLVGRDAEITAIRRELLQENVRLLTLTGPGGAGKTRLALQTAAFLLDDFVDGVFYVALAAIDDPALVVAAVARTLGLAEQQGAALSEMVSAHLRNRQLLLLLDNFEQVLGAAPALADWLAAAPGLKILVTSRERLALYGEHEYQVSPLAFPSLDHLPALSSLLAYPAIALFVERARAVRADFTLDAISAPIVAEICARLDGLPLAIELAAARVRFLSPAAILARLADRLQLLSGGPRDLPARQQSLRAAIAWSYDMLEAPEQRLFARLAVFRGGAALASIEAVCADAAVPDVFASLESLVDKSLLRMLDGDDEPRFDMLESVAAYALAQLAVSGEVHLVQRRHAEAFLALAENAADQLTGPEQIGWLNHLEREHDNLRAALRWSREIGARETEMRLSQALWPFWLRRGYWSEGEQRLQEALDGRETEAPESSSAANVLRGLGVFANERADAAAAQRYLSASLARYRRLGDDRGAAFTLNDLGYTALLNKDIARARALSTESQAMLVAAGDAWGVAVVLNTLGAIALAEGDAVEATRLCEDSLQRLRKVGDAWNMALALNNLSLAALPQGDYAGAARYSERSLALFRAVSSPAATNAQSGSLAAILAQP